MCGICLTVLWNGANTADAYRVHDRMEVGIRARGPDSYNRVDIGDFACLAASVLHVRGDLCCQQPLQTKDGILAYNGELYGLVDEHQSDTAILAQDLADSADPLPILQNLRNPHALVYFDKSSSTFLIARDMIGRRSLISSVVGGLWVFSSLSCGGTKVSEVPPGTVTAVSRKSGKLTVTVWTNRPAIPGLKDYLSTIPVDYELRHHHIFTELTKVNRILVPNSPLLESYHKWNNFVEEQTSNLSDPETVLQYFVDCFSNVIAEFLSILRSSVNDRLESRWRSSNRPVGLLFSGGVDSLLLTALVAEILSVPQCSTDMGARSGSNAALHGTLPENGSLSCENRSKPCVELLNVCFVTENAVYNIPDRATGQLAYEALRTMFDGVAFDLVPIDVTEDRVMRSKPKLQELLAPLDSVLDESLAMGIYFAAGGKVSESGLTGTDSGSAKILFSGIGPDELLAGYARHRTKCTKGGIEPLLVELEMELNRIGHRNLGRDDRMVSCHGKELRMPYLDERFIGFCNRLHHAVKFDLRLPKGMGDKLLLRSALYSLGFPVHLCTKEKRALQFGSRAAKMQSALKGIIS